MKKIIRNLIGKFGYSIYKRENYISVYNDIEDEKEFWEIYNFCKPYTKTGIERMYALYCAVNNILINNIPGDFVECGVWRGGSSRLIGKMLSEKGITNRKIYLYDTFEGMTPPTEDDKDLNGYMADKLMKESEEEDKGTTIWCVADLQDVQQNMESTGLPLDNIVLVKGKVEDTIPDTVPEGPIALLRLDTDWYDSTKHELVHLYPKLEINGILIIDDYGHWQGCRKATDEYFNENKIGMLLNRIDYTGRMGVKTSILKPDFK
jgi:hypothetical protein